MPQILDGRAVRDSIVPKLIEQIKNLKKVPFLAIIQVGDRPDSTAFISAKKSFAKKIGIKEKHIKLPANISQEEIIEEINKCNADNKITGIIVQLPLPENINRDEVINSIVPRKDVDGLTKTNTILCLEGSPKAVMPATARGIRELLNFYEIPLKDKNVVVIGRSALVGKPIAAMCLEEGAKVVVCHSQTKDLRAETKNADIIISATGKAGLLTDDKVKEDAVVIDVGITRQENGLLVGDADFLSVSKKISKYGAISPVPGGVGPMTVCALFQNVVDLCK